MAIPFAYKEVGLASGHSVVGDWRRHPGRPHTRWTDQLRNKTGSVPAKLWRQAILRGHGGATWAGYATQWWWQLWWLMRNVSVICFLWAKGLSADAAHSEMRLVYANRSTAFHNWWSATFSAYAELSDCLLPCERIAELMPNQVLLSSVLLWSSSLYNHELRRTVLPPGGQMNWHTQRIPLHHSSLDSISNTIQGSGQKWRAECMNQVSPKNSNW